MSAAAFAPLTRKEAPAPGLLSWYAIRVKSNREHVTSLALHEKGYEEYAPTYRTRRFWSDRVKELDLPLFPGYVFCRFDENNRLPILTTPGILSVVGIGKVPVAVDEQEIARIQAIVRSGVLAYPWPFLRTGQKVIIAHGPLTGVEGLLLSIKNQYRLVVSITLLQRSVAAEIDRDCVEPLH